ncbi:MULTISPECIES: nucleoside-diphosphate sugar epimerase/dehydratase [unclassified Sulfitobacter]|uniref:polysaccharide biosynthesis protein n=1 Tax=unclassified Sulfitobacter TaxID=196795 RepID=UPI0023E15404|nr:MULTISPECIES: nucleoside-diphosphate sugar epimerase/dehydratase [unclassified Sulfitobacter]MDF3384603.1 polysaccharide biosynthesis protein [Sulfitobacter sp. Ks11]MDF3388091.1 polysaccharide biosynthesis protein [Sulfitobacter sp. M85]MDF3391512.1 polysaccharide biosynthesis protein [Sulfitobacter sp. Ks16]MDF3402078.1 polysaccharide biosynthesis protein [Sulfitobacter sp. KE39]MDF3405570.1 polysaccharide biosynthesis protein [Sulfitobacter sp. Ks35]
MYMVDLHALPRSTKRKIFFVVDALLIPLSFYLAFALRYGTLSPWHMMRDALPLFALITLLGVGVISVCRLQHIKLNAFETRAMTKIGIAAVSMAFLAIVLSYLMGLSGPRSVPAIFGTLFFVSSVGTRLTGLALLNWEAERSGSRQRVAIYGAGAAGIQLASALHRSHEAQPVCFFDDNPNLQGLLIGGLPVHAPNKLQRLIPRRKVKKILLAIPSLTSDRRDVLIETLSNMGAEVQVLPSYIDLMSGKSVLENLRPVDPDELLGRDKVDLDTPEIFKAYAGRVVMVTGAGGSIGSELCRQLINRKPARIVLFEQGEFALYSIDRDLRPRANAAGIPVSSRLGSVVDKDRVSRIIEQEGVEIVLHAAAYKHVPLVEENELEGARNNVLGTKVVAEACQAAGVERFILISTDKAVRPTNIMGATKRMAEMVVQDLQTRSPAPKCAMVRFGNVLGSSGSVLPLFQKQIEQGGPLTVTHPEVTRFFMTIPEAARLVLLAGAYAEGGDVFVLDMGKPRKIIDIARQMIELSGRKVKDHQTEGGDIGIEVTGLRPGEKLYEELLIDSDSLRTTPHPKIMRAEEGMLSQIEVAAMLRELKASIAEGDIDRLRRLIAAKVEGYHLQDPTEASQQG